MKKIYFFKWIFVFMILFVTLWGITVVAQDSVNRWSFGFGGHYTGFEGFVK